MTLNQGLIMDLFQAMTVCVKVVEGGSMTAAAQECGMSTTMVGNHLRALEQRLGVSLLKRTTRKQSLTGFGGQYYQRCLEVLGLVPTPSNWPNRPTATCPRAPCASPRRPPSAPNAWRRP